MTAQNLTEPLKTTNIVLQMLLPFKLLIEVSSIARSYCSFRRLQIADPEIPRQPLL